MEPPVEAGKVIVVIAFVLFRRVVQDIVQILLLDGIDVLCVWRRCRLRLCRQSAGDKHAAESKNKVTHRVRFY